jgi:hypothetical protein
VFRPYTCRRFKLAKKVTFADCMVTKLERLLKINPLKIVASGEFVEIDNATYYIGTFGYSRDEAKMACESMNMTMISFEGDEQKWRSINIWIRDNGTL